MNSQTLLSKNGLEALQSKAFHTATSSNSNEIDLTVNDDNKINTGTHVYQMQQLQEDGIRIAWVYDLTSTISKSARLTSALGRRQYSFGICDKQCRAGKTYVTSSKSSSGMVRLLMTIQDPNDTTDSDEYLTAQYL